MGTLLFLCAVFDLKSRRIPILVLGMMNMLAIFLCLLCRERFFSVCIGVFVGGLFLLISKLTKEAIGYGDSYLMLIFGIYLGGLSVLQLLFLASFLSGVFSLICLCFLKWKRKATLPFVPFMAIAYVGVMCL